MMQQDLRGFLSLVAEDRPDEFIHLTQPLDPRFDVTALVLELERSRRSPILMVDHVTGSSIPLVTNVLGTRARLGLALGVSEEHVMDEFAQRIKTPLSVERVERAAVHENVEVGDAVDIRKLPILTHYQQDGGPYITAGLLIARDPHSGTHTCGYHRLMLKGPRKLGVSLHSRRSMFEWFRRSEEMGKPLEAAIAIGVHPLIGVGSATLPVPPTDKFQVMGALFSQPLQVARCKTIDVDVPAWAEIVIEGKVINDVREPEGPFGEFTGYVSHRGTENVFEVDAITYRNAPIYHDMHTGLSMEQGLTGGFPKSVEIYNTLSKSVGNIKDVHVPIKSGNFHCYISMRKKAEGHAKQAIYAALGVDHYVKIVVVVDEDIDIFDEQQMLWAIGTRVRAGEDILITPKSMGTVLDPSADGGTIAKIGIDATRPLDAFPETVSLPDSVRQKARDILESYAVAR